MPVRRGQGLLFAERFSGGKLPVLPVVATRPRPGDEQGHVQTNFMQQAGEPLYLASDHNGLLPGEWKVCLSA